MAGEHNPDEVFNALQDVSFSVKHGETFGVIGPNGCGKSTLLKVLAGVLYPDSGRVKMDGKIAPFLELGVGFQPELSARDNVYLYGAIMGLTRKDVDQRYDEIMDFSELKRFENMKLQKLLLRNVCAPGLRHGHSDQSGYYAGGRGSVRGRRVLPEESAEQKIDEIRRAGKTILLVSHSLGTVKQLCNRCLLMNHGQMVALGETEDVLAEYERMRAASG